MAHESQGKAQALLHTQREVLELLFSRPLQPDLLEHLIHAGIAGDAPLDAVILQILSGGEIGVEAGSLHHGPGASAHLFKGGALPLLKKG